MSSSIVFFISLACNKVVDIVNVCFVEIFLPQFLTNSLINTLIFEVGHLHDHFGMLDAGVTDDCWDFWIWVGEGGQGIGHDGWLTALYVGLPKVPLQILHRTGKLVRGSHPKVEDINFLVTAPTLKVSLGFVIWNFIFGLSLLTSVLLGLG